jgi:hypothetical protein
VLVLFAASFTVTRDRQRLLHEMPAGKE